MNNFMYGMWCMWFIMCVYAWTTTTLNGYLAFYTIAIIIPGLLVMVGRGVALLVKWCAFKWERKV